MKSVRARLRQHTAALWTKAGRARAVKLLGAACVDRMPVIVDGVRQGRLCGYVHWRVAETAGIVAPHGVVKVGDVIDVWVSVDRAGRDAFMQGQDDPCQRSRSSTYSRVTLEATRSAASMAAGCAEISVLAGEISNARELFFQAVALFTEVGEPERAAELYARAINLLIHQPVAGSC